MRHGASELSACGNGAGNVGLSTERVEGRPKHVLGEAAQDLSSHDRREICWKGRHCCLRQMLLFDDRQITQSQAPWLKLTPVY